ncbi:hypothetical protein Tco_0799329 [Tanacetum coccineum]|uniref:Uncharacterized protein n=1 Tax=Tanacetum coccineum TaxID=301880 RepID=A0ABQ4ZSW0_9ASTR
MIKQVFLNEEVVVDVMDRNLAHPQGVTTGNNRKLLEHFEHGILFFKGNIDLGFQWISKYGLATILQLLRMHNIIVQDSDYAKQVAAELVLVTELRHDYFKANDIVEKNLDVYVFNSSWFLVKFMRRYVVSSLMDTAYSQKIFKRSVLIPALPCLTRLILSHGNNEFSYTIREKIMESTYFSLLMKAHSRWDGAEMRLLQGLPRDIYKLINHNTDAKDIWDNVKMLLKGSELTKDDCESYLYDEFEHFEQHKGENIHDYYVRFTKLINDMRHIKITMPKIQLNSKFVNNMLPEWGRFMMVVKLNKGLKESNHYQLYAYLKQHELHANENKMLMERLNQHSHDPLTLVSNVLPS